MFKSMILLAAATGACTQIRQTEQGAKYEELLEASTETVIEKISERVGLPIDIHIDFDPDHNLHKRCLNCQIHCQPAAEQKDEPVEKKSS